MYLTTCWTFAAVRWWHTCSQPKERHRYIWPDRNMQCLLYMCATVLLPYVIDPTSPSAWLLQKSYFPATYSNPDDFPDDYARRVWLFPVILTPLIWPAYILDSPDAMAVQNVLLSVSNVWLLLTVMPVWRRRAILAMPEAEHPQESDEHADAGHEELIAQTAMEIEAYVRDQKAYLNPHLKIDDVVEHCQYGRTNVSLTFQRRFGSFANYVNTLRLAYYDEYVEEHPAETKEAAALAAGFSSYTAYYRAKQKLVMP